MEPFREFLLRHADMAHWYIFIGILLAGMNIPISLDVLIILSAVLAATLLPEHLIPLFLSVFLGCYFSAWIAYGLGRFLGTKLLRFRIFSKLLTPTRLSNIQKFNQKYGLLTLIVGRYIPFGIRNCIFMTSGITKMPFLKFIWRDAIASFIWSSSCFYLFYILGQNFQTLYHYMKAFNLLLFSAFCVTVIAIIWYKRKKSSRKLPEPP